jgi:hypothetical protein
MFVQNVERLTGREMRSGGRSVLIVEITILRCITLLSPSAMMTWVFAAPAPRFSLVFFSLQAKAFLRVLRVTFCYRIQLPRIFWKI